MPAKGYGTTKRKVGRYMGRYTVQTPAEEAYSDVTNIKVY